MGEVDSTVIVAMIMFVGGIISVIVSIAVAALNIRGAQSQVSDEIATGASELIREYKDLRAQDKETINLLEERVTCLEKVTAFFIPVLDGATRLHHQVLALKGNPVYNPPKIPEWLQTEIDKEIDRRMNGGQ